MVLRLGVGRGVCWRRSDSDGSLLGLAQMAQVSSSPGLIICEQSEGYANRQPDDSVIAYWDDLGCVWTCGFGSTGSTVTASTRWSRQQAVGALLMGWDVARSGVLRASPCLAGP